MRKLFVLLLLSILNIACSCSKKVPENFVLVKGGSFKNTNSNYYNSEIIISDFYISKYELTQKEWIDIMGSNPSEFVGDNLPVEMVTWYDSIEYCNERSLKEGLTPYYKIDKTMQDTHNISEYDNVKWTVTINEDADGYRLPTETEWEYAASGGQLSKGYTFSGNNDADEVAWYWRNAGDTYLSGDWTWSSIQSNNNQTKPVGEKKPNELGLYDMSGNVREWCYDWYQDSFMNIGIQRVWKGGGWIGDAISSELTYRGKFEANGMGSDQGFRVCRNK